MLKKQLFDNNLYSEQNIFLLEVEEFSLYDFFSELLDDLDQQ